jgi:hypothetical protein
VVQEVVAELLEEGEEVHQEDHSEVEEASRIVVVDEEDQALEVIEVEDEEARGEALAQEALLEEGEDSEEAQGVATKPFL